MNTKQVWRLIIYLFLLFFSGYRLFFYADINMFRLLHLVIYIIAVSNLYFLYKEIKNKKQ